MKHELLKFISNCFRKHRENIPISLTKDEMSLYVKRFNGIDREKKGYITVNDMTRSMQVKYPPWPPIFLYKLIFWLKSYFKEHGEKISGTELHSVLSEIDTNNNGQVELEEYLQVFYTFYLSYFWKFKN